MLFQEVWGGGAVVFLDQEAKVLPPPNAALVFSH